MDERLSVDVEQQGAGVVLRLAGWLDAHTTPVLAGALQALLGERARVSLDLANVVAIDGAGIDLLLDAQKAAEHNGHALTVTGLQESLRRRAMPRPPAGQTAAPSAQ